MLLAVVSKRRKIFDGMFFVLDRDGDDDDDWLNVIFGDGNVGILGARNAYFFVPYKEKMGNRGKLAYAIMGFPC